MSGQPIPLKVRFQRLTIVDAQTGCHLWQGQLNADGYGTIHIKRRHRRAHRVAYEVFVGPIPDGLTIDHVKARGCIHRHCVNPDHLEPVTQEENMRRARRATCPAGHPYDYVEPSGKRRCRRCRNAWRRAHESKEWRVLVEASRAENLQHAREERA